MKVIALTTVCLALPYYAQERIPQAQEFRGVRNIGRSIQGAVNRGRQFYNSNPAFQQVGRAAWGLAQRPKYGNALNTGRQALMAGQQAQRGNWRGALQNVAGIAGQTQRGQGLAGNINRGLDMAGQAGLFYQGADQGYDQDYDEDYADYEEPEYE